MKSRYIFIFSIILLLIGCGNGIASKEKIASQAQIVSGVIDLSNYNFSVDGPLKLNGEWEFYWSEFLDTNSSPAPHVFIKVPEGWNKAVLRFVDGKKEYYPSYGFATYRVLLRSLDVHTEYSIHIPRIGTAYQAFVNGKLLAKSGKISKSEGGSVPQYLPQSFSFYPTQEAVELLIQVSNYSYKKAGIYEEIEIGLSTQMMRESRVQLYTAGLTVGVILAMGLYYISLFFLRRKDLSPLYFGIIAILVAIRIIQTGDMFLMQFFPNFDWYLFYKIIYVDIGILTAVFALFTATLFREEFNRTILKAFIVFGIVTSFLAIVVPTELYYEINNIVQIIIIAGAGYGTFLLINALRNKRLGAPAFLLGFLLLFITVVNDILYQNGIIKSFYMLHWGYMALIFSQSFVLSQRFTNAFNTVEVQSGEINELNRTLELKVLERTGQIEVAMQTIRELAIRDELTGLFNRRRIMEMLEDERNRSSRGGGIFCLTMLDIDHFKNVNDRHGHLTGDAVLRAVATSVQENMRNTDFCGRYGGEEFLLVYTQTNSAGAINCAERLRSKVENLMFPDIGPNFRITVSLGLTEYHQNDDVEKVIARADAALYLAKGSGRNRVEFSE